MNEDINYTEEAIKKIKEKIHELCGDSLSEFKLRINYSDDNKYRPNKMIIIYRSGQLFENEFISFEQLCSTLQKFDLSHCYRVYFATEREAKQCNIY